MSEQPMGMSPHDSFPPRASHTVQAKPAKEPEPPQAVLTLTWSSIRSLATVAALIVSALGLALTVGAYLVRITQSVATKDDLARVEKRLEKGATRSEKRLVAMQQAQQKRTEARHKELLGALRELRTRVDTVRVSAPPPAPRRKRRRRRRR